jgi:hypothetical protein
LIGIERRGLRRHPDNHQFSFRVDVNELPVDAEPDQHAVIAVDAPIVSFCPANVCGKPITFQGGLNLNVAFVDAAYSCKGPLPAKKPIRQGTKRRCCRAVTVANDPCSGTAVKQPN